LGMVSASRGGFFVLLISVAIGVVGCLLFWPFSFVRWLVIMYFALICLSFFVTGIEVSGNVIVDKLGAKETSASRLTFVHMLDSTGTVFGPIFAAFLFFNHNMASIRFGYALLGGILCFLFFGIYKSFRRNTAENKMPTEVTSENKMSTISFLKSNPTLVFGVIAIFTYVGVEVSIANFIIPFAQSPQILGFSIDEAVRYVSLYWVFALIGRILAPVILNFVKDYYLLISYSFFAIILLVIAIIFKSNISIYALVLTGFANSIMYPTIVSMSIRDLGPQKERGSGILHLGVFGGAVFPILQGLLADNVNVVLSFMLPIFLYAYIGFFGISTLSHIKKVVLK